MSDTDGSGRGFLRRWSERKQETATRHRGGAAAPVLEEAPDEAALPELVNGDERPLTEEEQEIVAALPDIDSLSDESDFAPFMQDKVPEFLRRRALRMLWRVNPVLANVDGLVDYGDDFTDAATVVEGLQTAYKVGKGFLTDEERAEMAGETPADKQPEADTDEEIVEEAVSAEEDSPAAGEEEDSTRKSDKNQIAAVADVDDESEDDLGDGDADWD